MSDFCGFETEEELWDYLDSVHHCWDGSCPLAIYNSHDEAEYPGFSSCNECPYDN